MRVAQFILGLASVLTVASISNAAGSDVLSHIKSLHCSGTFRTGFGKVEVAYSEGGLMTVAAIVPGEADPGRMDYVVEKAEVNESRTEIGGFLAGTTDKSLGILITIPHTDGKARVWKVTDGLEEVNVYDYVDLENTTLCQIETK